MSARQKARKRAVDLLFESDLRGRDAFETLAERQGDPDRPVPDFAASLVRGVATHRPDLDAQIADALSENWTLDRMPRVDRTICRVAAYELGHTATPPRVVIAEAVGLAQMLSTDDSPAFVNAVLAALAERGGHALDRPETS